MLKLKLQYFGHLMRRAESLEKTLMLGKIEGRRRRGPQRNGLFPVSCYVVLVILSELFSLYIMVASTGTHNST